MSDNKKTKFFSMRMKPELHELLKKEAEKEHRSLTDQINYILSKYFA